MTYEELLATCKRAASAAPEVPVESLLDVIQLVTLQHGPATRPFAADRLMFLLAEYIEAPTQQAMRAMKH